MCSTQAPDGPVASDPVGVARGAADPAHHAGADVRLVDDAELVEHDFLGRRQAGEQIARHVEPHAAEAIQEAHDAQERAARGAADDRHPPALPLQEKAVLPELRDLAGVRPSRRAQGQHDPLARLTQLGLADHVESGARAVRAAEPGLQEFGGLGHLVAPLPFGRDDQGLGRVEGQGLGGRHVAADATPKGRGQARLEHTDCHGQGTPLPPARVPGPDDSAPPP